METRKREITQKESPELLLAEIEGLLKVQGAYLKYMTDFLDSHKSVMESLYTNFKELASMCKHYREVNKEER